MYYCYKSPAKNTAMDGFYWQRRDGTHQEDFPHETGFNCKPSVSVREKVGTWADSQSKSQWACACTPHRGLLNFSLPFAGICESHLLDMASSWGYPRFGNTLEWYEMRALKLVHAGSQVTSGIKTWKDMCVIGWAILYNLHTLSIRSWMYHSTLIRME